MGTRSNLEILSKDRQPIPRVAGASLGERRQKIGQWAAMKSSCEHSVAFIADFRIKDSGWFRRSKKIDNGFVNKNKALLQLNPVPYRANAERISKCRGHCVRAASQALLKELLGKGLARRGSWLCCVDRPSPMGIDLPPRLARDPSALPPFRKFISAFALTFTP